MRWTLWWEKVVRFDDIKCVLSKWNIKKGRGCWSKNEEGRDGVGHNVLVVWVPNLSGLVMTIFVCFDGFWDVRFLEPRHIFPNSYWRSSEYYEFLAPLYFCSTILLCSYVSPCVRWCSRCSSVLLGIAQEMYLTLSCMLTVKEDGRGKKLLERIIFCWASFARGLQKVCGSLDASELIVRNLQCIHMRYTVWRNMWR